VNFLGRVENELIKLEPGGKSTSPGWFHTAAAGYGEESETSRRPQGSGPRSQGDNISWAFREESHPLSYIPTRPDFASKRAPITTYGVTRYCTNNNLPQDVLTPAECQTFVDFINNQPLELTPPKKRGEADRVNCKFPDPLPPSAVCTQVAVIDRVSISSPEFADRLWTILGPHLPLFPYPASMKRLDSSARAGHSLNSNIRLYKYTPSQHFNPHYDDSIRDAKTGAVSEWTLLIYLTGVEGGVQGGEVGAMGTLRDVG